MTYLKFRAWDKKRKKMRDLDFISFHNERSVFDYCASKLPKMFGLWGYDVIEQKDFIIRREENDVEVMQYLPIKDIHGKEVCEKDLIRIFVKRKNYHYDTNVNHGGFYLTAEILDVRGNLKYDKQAVEDLEAPKGRELHRQLVGHDHNLFDLYYAKRNFIDATGAVIMEEVNGGRRPRYWIDIEIVGNTYEKGAIK